MLIRVECLDKVAAKYEDEPVKIASLSNFSKTNGQTWGREGRFSCVFPQNVSFFKRLRQRKNILLQHKQGSVVICSVETQFRIVPCKATPKTPAATTPHPQPPTT
jgi:hypothetical protein